MLTLLTDSVVNMQGFWVWQDFDYERVSQGSKYAIVWLNVSEFTLTEF